MKLETYRQIENDIIGVIGPKLSYASSRYIADRVKQTVEDTEWVLHSSNKFRRSAGIMHEGKWIYIYNSFRNTLLDFWKSFQHINYRKY